MWLRRPVRDLLDTLAVSAPDAWEALGRAREETLDLLVALFRPVGSPDPAFRAEVARELDAALAERAGGAALLTFRAA